MHKFEKPPSHIVVLGGGTAGWMAANLLIDQLAKWRINITLIESSNIPTVGVGEGSTPYLKEFFETLGIEENEWMPACNATFKCGIRFPDWSTKMNQSSYFHPFYGDFDGQFAQTFFDACNSKRRGQPEATNPDHYFLNYQLARQNKAPKSENRNDNLNYGYHFDSALLAKFLKQHAIKNGVRHIDDNVENVYLDKLGNIAVLATQNFGPIRGEYFIDCSGFRGLLIQQTLGEKLTSYEDFLYCDRAIALPSSHQNSDIPSETISRGMNAGWMWNIPLANRLGNGYVYSSRHLDKQTAEKELRDALNLAPDMGDALHLSWTPGRITQHWKKNCIAVGLSQGFLEPLEAPMLFIIQRTIEGFIEHFINGGFSDKLKDKFNQELNIIFDGTRDYLQAHYKLNSRSDNPFWIDSRLNSNMSKPLSDILAAWLDKGNFDEVLAEHQHSLAYLKTSWYCLLAGHGYFATESQSNTALYPSKILTNNLEMLSNNYLNHKDYLHTMKAV